MKWYVVVLVDGIATQFLTPKGLKEYIKPEEERFLITKGWRLRLHGLMSVDIKEAQVFTDKSEAERIANEVPHSKVLSDMGLVRL